MALAEELWREQLRRAGRQGVERGPTPGPGREGTPKVLSGGAKETGRYVDQTGEVPWYEWVWGVSTW